ncbi:MAG: hypothetical protein M3O02_09910 [Acidobacteriota bacterium]|nr:hypothetical protein [Acidobacteriota bacterium]
MSNAHQAEPQYLGVPIYFAGHTWLVPSLSVRQMQKYLPLFEHPIVGDTVEALNKRFETYIPVVGVAIRRNYPGVTDESLFESLDAYTFSEAVKAIQGASGLKAVKPGEAETQTAP